LFAFKCGRCLISSTVVDATDFCSQSASTFYVSTNTCGDDIPIQLYRHWIVLPLISQMAQRCVTFISQMNLDSYFTRLFISLSHKIIEGLQNRGVPTPNGHSGNVRSRNSLKPLLLGYVLGNTVWRQTGWVEYFNFWPTDTYRSRPRFIFDDDVAPKFSMPFITINTRLRSVRPDPLPWLYLPCSHIAYAKLATMGWCLSDAC
jgi:hypothetical protein